MRNNLYICLVNPQMKSILSFTYQGFILRETLNKQLIIPYLLTFGSISSKKQSYGKR